ncbi:hypothetical protein [Rheinheimera oceanensis]|uniref:hypothetical protein n=1 Tax=Rheinheimera oceanensis TaxID=2817449 RepID=UPI001BFD4DDF|nr:hypothetical protein [Rheinheimera oceanensis]
MISIEHTHAYKAYIVEKHFNRRVGELTTLLITALFIDPHAKTLVGTCGSGTEKDNAAVIYSWVRQQACCASCILELDVKTLQRRLVRYLLDIAVQHEYIE